MDKCDHKLPMIQKMRVDKTLQPLREEDLIGCVVARIASVICVVCMYIN